MAHISPCECSSDSNVFEPMILFVHCWYIVRAARQKEGNSWNSRTPNPSNLGDPGAWHTAQPAGISWNAKRSKSRSRSPPKTDTNIIKPEVCCWHLLTHPKNHKILQLGTRGWSLAWSPTIPNIYPSVFQGPMCWSKVIRRRFFGEDPAYHSRDICILLFLQLDLSEIMVSQMDGLSSLSLRKEPWEDILGYTVIYPIFGLQYRYWPIQLWKPCPFWA